MQNFHTKRNPIFHQQEEHPQISLKMIYSIHFFIFLQKNVSEFSKNNSKDNIISVELAQVLWYYSCCISPLKLVFFQSSFVLIELLERA